MIETRTSITLTCDNCGAIGHAPGLVGWFQILRHPEGVDTRDFAGDHRIQWDLCSTYCVKALVIR